MLAVFCLRLAWGMIVSLVILPREVVHPRFFRVHYLTALGLLAVAGFFLREESHLWTWVALCGSGLCCIAGSIAWHLDGQPLVRTILALALVFLSAALVLGGHAHRSESDRWEMTADDFTSGALLGSSTTAMLMGHSYLLAPGMTLAPLLRSLAGLGVTLLCRVVAAGLGLWLWTGHGGSANLDGEMQLFLPVRWLLGFVGPLVLGWMAWETARIRSTQSATGILYVVVIVCFLGELTSQLLVAKTGYIL